MKILWISNIILPELCHTFGIRKTSAGGWITGLWGELKKQTAHRLAICLPVCDEYRMKDGRYENYQFYSFYARITDGTLHMAEQRFMNILSDFQPDIVHIWGTEYLHSLAMLRACGRCNLSKQVVVNIQGLVSFCALHYDFGLKQSVVEKESGGNSIKKEMDNFRLRGMCEKEVLKNVRYVIGRTEWDRACVMQINPALNYFHCGEILRNEFYENEKKWSSSTCRRHSIFISQAAYPLKGFHLIIKTLAELKAGYPDLSVYIAGTNLMEYESVYAEYIRQEISKQKLEDTIIFTGRLSAGEMLGYYNMANVFLSASTIENSSNSICEAMCTGVPVVSGYVGGCPSLIEHGTSGFLYPLNECYMLRYYIEKIFEDPLMADHISKNEIKRSQKLNNIQEIVSNTLDIYDSIVKESVC